MWQVFDIICYVWVVFSVFCLSPIFLVIWCGCARGALLYEFPGGNQVDGLPPVFNIDPVVVGPPRRSANMCDLRRNFRIFGLCFVFGQ